MGDEEHLMCVTWNTHKDALISLFDNLLQEESLVDCTLAAEGQYIKAHKIIISACSPYLQKLLSEHSENHPIIILNETKFLDLKCILEYMYRGEVNMSKREIPSFMKTAEALQIRGLTNSKTREELLQESRRCSSGQRRKRRRQNRDSDARAEDLEGRPSFGSPSLNDSVQTTSDTNKERSTNGDNTANNEAQQNEIFEMKQETILDVDLTQEEAALEIPEPRPSTSSEASANHLNYTGYSSEPLAISNEEHDMEMEGYDSNIDNSEDLQVEIKREMSDSDSLSGKRCPVKVSTIRSGDFIFYSNSLSIPRNGQTWLTEDGKEDILIKKSTKSRQFTTFEHYRQYREKNNESCKRSRLNRRIREFEFEQEALNLEERNMILKQRVQSIERLKDKIKNKLHDILLRKGEIL